MKLLMYHSADHDGHCSGAIAKLYCEKNNIPYQLCPINYGDKIPDLIGLDAILMDFSIQPVELMQNAINTANDFVWIDHHVSAIKDFENSNIKGIRNINLSACELTWMYFFPNEPIPMAVTYFGSYDSWRHNDDLDILGFEWYYRCFDTDPEIFDWNTLFNMNDTQIKEKSDIGKLMLQKDMKSWSFQLKTAFKKTINGQNVLFINTQDRGSMIFGTCLKDYDWTCCYYQSNNKIKNSLYSHKTKTDVSVIAKLLGGGGHSNASGVTTDKPIWELLPES